VEDKVLKKKTERGVAQSFLNAYNAANRSAFRIIQQTELTGPDFTCREEEGKDTFGLEVTVVYYSDHAAKGLWDMMRGRSAGASGAVCGPEDLLARVLTARLEAKWNKRYGPRCVLVVHVDGPITTPADFEERVLPLVGAPVKRSPFEEAYVRLAGKSGEPECVWWQVYPQKQRVPW
jgi:hypothetical protein